VDTDMIVVAVAQPFSVPVRSACGVNVARPGAGGLQRQLVLLTMCCVDTRNSVAQRGAEVRSKEEVDDEVCRRADDDQHVADVVRVRDGVRTAKHASLVLQYCNRYLQQTTI